MKNKNTILLLAFISFLTACANFQTGQNGYLSQEDMARLEIYKLNNFFNNECKILVDKMDGSVESMTVLSTSVILDTVIVINDTTNYYFGLWGSETKGFPVIISSNPKQSYPFCATVFGVGYIGNSNVPFIAFIEESAYSIYGRDIFPAEIDSCFVSELQKNKSKISPWLYEKLQKKNSDKKQ